MERAGHECIGACEIDDYARRVYGKHFPDVPIWKDATTLDPKELPEFDCLVGGFPCQAFSIAGKRRGFDDTRGSLFFEIARIAKEKRPQYLLLENVKGLLNHDEGRTFRVILATLQELGYDVEWQVLNSKYFVPQNRERVFLIGHLGGFSGRKIFPLGKVGKIPNDECSKQKELQMETSVVGAIDASYYKGPDGKRTMLSVPEPKLKRIEGKPNVYNTDAQAGKIYNIDGISPTVSGQRVNSQGFIAVEEPKIVADRSRNLANKGRNLESPKNITNSLTSVAKDNYVMTMLSNKNANMKNRTQERKETWTLQTSGADFGIHDKGRKISNTIRTSGRGSFDRHSWDIVNQGTRIRRLTPKECERLQGFPDDWTEGISDTQRYKCCGNAVTVPVVQYIAEHLL